MTKPTTKHTTAIHQSIRLLENALASAYEPKFKKCLQRDIKLHQEIHKMLYHLIQNPTLPFLDDRKGHKENSFDTSYLESSKHLADIDAQLEAELNPIDEEPNEAF